NRQDLDFGKTFEVSFQDTTLFSGNITALEAGFPETRSPEITVLAEDQLQEFRMTRRTRTFSDLSDSDIMQQIASDHGLGASINVSGPQHRTVAQLNQSDLA